jgi:hypothetical protein
VETLEAMFVWLSSPSCCGFHALPPIGAPFCSASLIYEYLSLATLPIVTSVTPGTGPTDVETPVTITGTGFQSRGVVTFESDAGVLIGECRWGPTIPNTSYTSNSVRWVCLWRLHSGWTMCGPCLSSVWVVLVCPEPRVCVVFA